MAEWAENIAGRAKDVACDLCMSGPMVVVIAKGSIEPTLTSLG